MLIVTPGPKDLPSSITDYNTNIRAESFVINHKDYLAHFVFNISPFFHKLKINQRRSFHSDRFVDVDEIFKQQAELLSKSRALAGYSLSELADSLNVKVPLNLKQEKGWVGMLIEMALGATAGSKPQQDFPELGIELKTIPLSHEHLPLETTYVCYAPLMGNQGITWETSNVRNKLQKVLWVPVQGEREIPVGERIIGRAMLWQPTENQDERMKNDWEELMDMICLGRVEEINASIGDVMQLRPKAANGKALTSAIGHDGKPIQTRPRGFYLRKAFTSEILNSQ